jgi:hypothetical protein
MIKKFLFLTGMMGLVGMPYVLSSSSQIWEMVSSRFQSDPAGGSFKSGTGATAAAYALPQSQRLPAGSAMQAPGIEGYGARDLAEVIQFNASPGWVLQRWPRVTAGLAELDLQGYRVPLVTGTGQDDLAGSLTYYFDRSQKAARIDFQGTTGDPRKLIALVTNQYHFEPQASNDPGLLLYQVKWNGKPQSELRIRPARVVRADQPYARYEVQLAMKRP